MLSKLKRLYPGIITIIISILLSTLCVAPVLAVENNGTQDSLDNLLGYYNSINSSEHWEVAVGLRWAGVECSDKYTPQDAFSASDYAGNILGSIAGRQDKEKVNDYVYSLIEIQNADGSFVNGSNTSLNQSIWAVIALDFAEQNGFTADYPRDAAVKFICDHQDISGGFDESGWGVDVDSTAHALIALAPDYQQVGKEDITAVIHRALNYLHGQQLESGGFGSWGTENPDSIAAVVEALMALKINPGSEEWNLNGNNMVDALLSYQSSAGWFVYSWEPSSWNDPTRPNQMSTYHALLALGDLARGQSKYSTLLPETDSSQSGDGNNGSPTTGKPGQQQSVALITVKGDGEQGTILESANYQFYGSCTALEALKGILKQNNITCIVSGEYVRSIGGLAEKKEGYPLSGWLFRINGSFPGVGAGSAIIRNGDQVEWLYTLDGGKDLGNTPVIDSRLQEKKDGVVDISGQYEKELKQLGEKNLIINPQESMSDKEMARLAQDLTENIVSLNKETGREGGILADNEVFLKIPENALNSSTRISVKEISQDKLKNPGIKICSSIYEFTPDGLNFTQDIYIGIKLAITDDINLERLTPAWYDNKTDQWIGIPSIIDLKNGQVVFRINHFTNFALIERIEEVKVDEPDAKQPLSFPDLDASFNWAREAIEDLAWKGIIKGTGNGYEPARNINRAEMVGLLVRIKGINTDNADLGFTDVKEDDWFHDSVGTASTKGWVSGYPDNSFRPYAPVSRNEAVSLLNRIFPADIKTTGSVASFSDWEEIPGWAQEAAVDLHKRGLVSGYPDGRFAGEGHLTRAEAAVMIYKLLNTL